MKRKGRIQAGADADIVVVDPAEFRDRATFERPGVPSAGMRHVLVHGEALITEGQLDVTALPGRPVRRPEAARHDRLSPATWCRPCVSVVRP